MGTIFPTVQIYLASDEFFRKDFWHRNRKQFVPAVASFAKQEQKQKQHLGLVAPRGRRRPKFCGVSRKKQIWDVVAHQRACLLEFWNKFPGFHRLKKHNFRRRSVEDLTNLRSGSQIFDKCMCHVCHDVRGVCVEDWQVGHSEDKSNWFSLIMILLLVVLRFEYSKFELFVGELWVVLTHEYYEVSIHATHDWVFHFTVTCDGCSSTIRAAWGSWCTDISSSSILISEPSVPWNHQGWFSNILFFWRVFCCRDFFLESHVHNDSPISV